MNKILVIGAGKSCSHLIFKLSEYAEEYNWQLTVADRDLRLASKYADKAGDRCNAIELDISDEDSLRSAIRNSTLVVSMLPARFHPTVANNCLEMKKHLFTASYVGEELRSYDHGAKAAGLLFMNEMGLDPGLDHMSALKVLHRLKEEGRRIKCFETFTGGLIAPESDDNPWNYKFTWNPRNVVLAGQGGIAKFVENGKYKYIPPHQLFRRTETIEIPDLGLFEGYANRDSLRYRSYYKLDDVPTLYRGTLRRKGFCKAWNTFVQLGMTDDTFLVEGSKDMSHRDFTNSFLFHHPTDSVKLKLKYYLDFDYDSDIMNKLDWLDLFSDEKIGFGQDATPAKNLEHILRKKWTLKPEDKDMIVMWHKFIYETKGGDQQLNSYMIVKGNNSEDTAMSLTVGHPLAIGIKQFLLGQFNLTGVHIPDDPKVYLPVLKELEDSGIVFTEQVV